MKRFNFLFVVLAVMVIGVSCTTTQAVSDENYDRNTTRQIGDRLYIDDPYLGTVVLERDPYTGRYYDVTNGRSRYGFNSFYSPYDIYGDRRYYRNYPTRVTPTQDKSTEERRREIQGQREEARRKVLGN